MRRPIATLLFISMLSFCMGQSPLNCFIANPPCDLSPNDLVMLDDGDVLITGRCFDCKYGKRSPISLYDGMFLMRVNPEGKVSAVQRFPAITGKAIDLLPDGGIVLAGFVRDYREKKYKGDNGRGVYIALLKADLSMRWDTIYASESNSEPEDVVALSEGEIAVLADKDIIEGTTFSGMPDIRPGIRVLGFDTTGAIIWEGQLESYAQHKGFAMTRNASGNPVIVGAAGRHGGKHKAFFLELVGGGHALNYEEVKTPEGKYGTTDDWAFAVTELKEGGYAVGGNSYYQAQGLDHLLVRFDKEGNVLWQQPVAGELLEHPSVVQLKNGTIVIASTFSDAEGKGRYISLVGFSPEGNKLWQRGHARGDRPESISLVPTKDGGMLLAAQIRPDTGTRRNVLESENKTDDKVEETDVRQNHGILLMQLNAEGKQ